MILVSACLVGLDCRYNGGSNLDKELMEFLKDKEFIVVCPEQMGGLPTPRHPCEIINGDGRDVLKGLSRVKNNQGEDVTEAFIKGAEETLKAAKIYKAKTAILKAKSPSCGSKDIYNGKFEGKTKEGMGVATALLRKNGILVLDEENYLNHDF